jgi:hypothetical protein
MRSGESVAAGAPRAALAAVIAVAVVVAATSINWRPTSRALETRNDYAGFLQFVTAHVPPDAQILAVPFFLTQRYSPVPYRAMYLDWVESNYVLYLGAFLDEAIARLASYGIDPFERPKGCTLAGMFFAGGAANPHFRCERLWFQHLAESSVTAWRDHVNEIEQRSPRTTWLLIRQDLLCAGERGDAWKDLRLLPLAQVVRHADCVGRQTRE